MSLKSAQPDWDYITLDDRFQISILNTIERIKFNEDADAAFYEPLRFS